MRSSAWVEEVKKNSKEKARFASVGYFKRGFLQLSMLLSQQFSTVFDCTFCGTCYTLCRILLGLLLHVFTIYLSRDS